MKLDSIQQESIKNIILNCGCISAKDQTLIICDNTTKEIAKEFQNIASENHFITKYIEIPDLGNHGNEPPEHVKDEMIKSTLIISLCRFSLAHSNARIQAAKHGARFLSLPLYDWNLLKDPSLRFDFKSQSNLVRKYSDKLTKGENVHITTQQGTDIYLDIRNRVGNYCPGFVENPGDLGSPPDIEANVSPVEHNSNGIVVIDGSITHPSIGLLVSPVTIIVEDGFITSFNCDYENHLDILNELFENLNSKKRILAECGIGLNPDAKLTGTMLTDEGAMGCMHFGFGANSTVGGLNEVDFHLDFVFKDPSLTVDGETLINFGKNLL